MRTGFYLNHALRLREAASGNEPDPVMIASRVETAGSDIILVGCNPETGLLRTNEIKAIRNAVNCDLLIVVPMTPGFIEPILQCRPDGVILVDSRWDGIERAKPVDVELDRDDMTELAAAYRASAMPVSVFMPPELDAARAVARTGVNGVVFDCSKYSASRTDEEAESAIAELDAATMAANKLGLVTALGHGLNYRNISHVAALKHCDEIYIGRAFVSRSLITGIDSAVSSMVDIVFRNRILSR